METPRYSLARYLEQMRAKRIAVNRELRVELAATDFKATWVRDSTALPVR